MGTAHQDTAIMEVETKAAQDPVAVADEWSTENVSRDPETFLTTARQWGVESAVR
jgi:hypothetical protein